MIKPDLILLALDASPFLQLVPRALRAASYNVVEAHTRVELERSLNEINPSLLLIGESVNGESGLQLAAAQLERFPTLPILLYVEKDSDSVAHEVLRAGLSGYIHPPLRTDDIVAAIRQALGRARRLGDWVRGEVKRTTASLQRQVTEFEAIFTNIGDGVLILDRQGHILLLNQAIQKFFKVTPESVIGKPVGQAIPHPDLLALLNRSTAEELKYHEINMDDGRVFNAQHTTIPNIGSAITIQDISYLKELDRLKSDFVHTVSHDLRSPLTAVLGYAELIGRTGPLNDHQNDFMTRLQNSVKEITTLVNDLLDIGRLDAGFDTRREIVHLEDILGYTIDLLGGSADAKNIEICIDEAPNLPSLKANPLRLRKMLDNLLDNAIKYTPTGGKIDIQLKAEASQVIFKIKDNGPGIPPGDQPHVFEKFYRGENVPDDTPGSGLGLAIVKSIVENHQGRVWVESTQNNGTTFSVVLPAYEPAAA